MGTLLRIKSSYGLFRNIVAMLLLTLCANGLQAQTWIWYPGDYEIWLSNRMQNRRTERGVFFPVFWKMDSHYPLIDFHKDVQLQQPETILIATEGQYNFKIDGIAVAGNSKTVQIPAGKHRINVKIYNQTSPPTLFIKGQTIHSDSSWLTTFEDKEWIDETGNASDLSATQYRHAGYWQFNRAETKPSSFTLPTMPMYAKNNTHTIDGLLIDFGKETFGFVKIHGVHGHGKLRITYGESREEAMDVAHAETYDTLDIDGNKPRDTLTSLSKAFRYIHIQSIGSVRFDSVSMLYEYADIQDKGSFRCNDAEINHIYDIAKYTLHLSTREFFIDGIKRDRWIWSGDAYQSYLMNYYLMNDDATVRRTIYALRGKDPVTSHINTIMDYTFYWFLSVYDYYLYTGDKSFLVENYDRMKTLMDYVLSRRYKNGFVEGLSGDWVFIDWAKGLSKKGAVSFEQVLFARSLETMAICAKLSGNGVDAANYTALSTDVKSKLFQYYWNPHAKAFMHSYMDGKQTDNITRYANMFGIFFNYFSDRQKTEVKDSVLLSDRVPAITTPYMRFYELESLCAMGMQDYVLKEMKNYWGGMLKLGATSFWEEYDPTKNGSEHYAMYGRPYGKSLCHAWGASPIYLLGKYYIGVSPTSPGYQTYTIRPSLGGLEWVDGKVPTPKGAIEVYCNRSTIKVSAPAGTGNLCFDSKTTPSCKEGTIRSLGAGKYEMTVNSHIVYHVSYQHP
ncbi:MULTISPECIES: alpha-L-rhamnosidase-related protein [Chitinophagaceae]